VVFCAELLRSASVCGVLRMDVLFARLMSNEFRCVCGVDVVAKSQERRG